MRQKGMEERDFVIRLRGLPWTASVDDVADFLDDCQIYNGKEGVHFTYVPDGRASGEAFVELASSEDIKKALSKNKQHMGKRYIDVFKVKRSEMEYALRHNGANHLSPLMDAVVRLRGLPYGCSKEEIANFFTGMEIVPNGITILSDHLGRTTGDAFVQFTTQDSVDRALVKHKDTIGHRYIEIFRSSCDELMGTLARECRQKGFIRPRPYNYIDRFSLNLPPGPGMPPMGPLSFPRNRMQRNYFDDGFDNFTGGYGPDCSMGGFGGFAGGMGPRNNSFGMGMGRGMRGKRPFVGGYRGNPTHFESQTGHSIHMRGLPYSATEHDIHQFFSPLSLVGITIQMNNDGRPSGDADVDFATHEDALEAMKKHRALMQKRYIELFLKSTPTGRSNFRGFGGGGFYGMGGNYKAF